MHEETSLVCTVLLGKVGESQGTAKIAFIKMMGHPTTLKI
jgi:hypothetical protein